MMKNMVAKALAWTTSEARWFMSADWKWGLIIVAIAAVLGTPPLFGFTLGMAK